MSMNLTDTGASNNYIQMQLFCIIKKEKKI